MLLTFDPLLMSTPRCVVSEEFLGSQRPSLLLSLTDHVFINTLQGGDLHWVSRSWASRSFPFLCYSVYFVPSSRSSLLSSSCVFKVRTVGGFQQHAGEAISDSDNVSEASETRLVIDLPSNEGQDQHDVEQDQGWSLAGKTRRPARHQNPPRPRFKLGAFGEHESAYRAITAR